VFLGHRCTLQDDPAGRQAGGQCQCAVAHQISDPGIAQSQQVFAHIIFVIRSKALGFRGQDGRGRHDHRVVTRHLMPPARAQAFQQLPPPHELHPAETRPGTKTLKDLSEHQMRLFFDPRPPLGIGLGGEQHRRKRQGLVHLGNAGALGACPGCPKPVNGAQETRTRLIAQVIKRVFEDQKPHTLKPRASKIGSSAPFERRQRQRRVIHTAAQGAYRVETFAQRHHTLQGQAAMRRLEPHQIIPRRRNAH